MELQVAIPKTMDAGKLVEQHQQNVIQHQLNASEALKKELERKKLTVSDIEPTEKITDEDRSRNRKEQHSTNEKQDKKQTQMNDATHPFKGHFFDFSG